MKRSYIYTLLAALLLAVVAFIFFAPDAALGNVLQQHDMQQGLANGHEVQQYHEATGESSRWTDALFGGMPTFQIAPSYAADGMLGWVQKLYTLWLPSPANLLFGMFIGFFIMLLCMGVRWPLALFGSLAWGFSTYFIIIIGAGHIWKFLTLMYVPPTIGGIALCYRRKYLAGSALAALFGSLQLMSNHPQMSYYFLFVVVAMMVAWAVDAARRKQMRSWVIATACCLGAGFIAVGANASSLYNSYEYAKETVRGRATDLRAEGEAAQPGMDRAAITAWSYGPDETLSLLIPNIKGGATIKPVGGQNSFLALTDTKQAEDLYISPEEMQFLSQFPQYFGDQPMTNGPVYVGAFILMLAILAMFVCDGKLAPMKWALFSVTVLAILLSWGHNFEGFTNFFIDNFPGYNKFRAVSSILVIVEFCIPVLAVMCVMKIIDTPDFYARYKWQFWCVMGFGALICLVGWINPSAFGQGFSAAEVQQLNEAGVFNDPRYATVWRAVSDVRLGMVSADSLRSLFFIGMGTLVLWLYFRGMFKSKPAIMVCLLSAVVIIDLFPVNKRYVNSDNFVEPTEAETTFTPTAADAEILRDKGHYRVMNTDDFGGARSSYFHNTVGGYHAAKLTRYQDLIDHQLRNGSPAAINMLNTKYFISEGKVIPNPDAWGNAWWVDNVTYVPDANSEMKGLDGLVRTRAVADKSFSSVLGKGNPIAPGDTIYLADYRPNRLTYKYNSAKGGVALFSEVYFPWGWQATVDGEPTPIGRANYLLRAMRLPAGAHEVVFTFDPKSQHVTNGISIASIILVYLLVAGTLAWLFVKYRKRPENGDLADKA